MSNFFIDFTTSSVFYNFPRAIVLLIGIAAIHGDFPTPAACWRRLVDSYNGTGPFGRAGFISLGFACCLPIAVVLGLVNLDFASIINTSLLSSSLFLFCVEMIYQILLSPSNE